MRIKSGYLQRTQASYQSCDIMQYLDLRQEEQISLESKNREGVRKEKVYCVITAF